MRRIILTATAWMFFALSVWAEDITIKEETFWQETNPRSFIVYPITEDQVNLLFEETQQQVSIQVTDSTGHLYFITTFSGDAYTISLQGMPQGEYHVSLQKENGQHGNLVLLKQ